MRQLDLSGLSLRSLGLLDRNWALSAWVRLGLGLLLRREVHSHVVQHLKWVKRSPIRPLQPLQETLHLPERVAALKEALQRILAGPEGT